MLNFLTNLFRSDAVSYEIVNRGDYYVIRRTYPNGNIRTDRISTARARSTMRTAVNGRTFPA